MTINQELSEIITSTDKIIQDFKAKILRSTFLNKNFNDKFIEAKEQLVKKFGVNYLTMMSILIDEAIKKTQIKMENAQKYRTEE